MLYLTVFPYCSRCSVIYCKTLVSISAIGNIDVVLSHKKVSNICKYRSKFLAIMLWYKNIPEKKRKDFLL